MNEDIGSALFLLCQHDSDVEAMHLTKSAQIIRQEMFSSGAVGTNAGHFGGLFAPNCQQASVPKFTSSTNSDVA